METKARIGKAAFPESVSGLWQYVNDCLQDENQCEPWLDFSTKSSLIRTDTVCSGTSVPKGYFQKTP